MSAIHIEELKQKLEAAMGDAEYAVCDLSAKERETCPQYGRFDLLRTLLNDG